MDKVNEVAAALAAGREPSVDSLGQVLAQAIEERDRYKQTTDDLVQWLGKLIKTHLNHDAQEHVRVMECFIAEHVKFMPKASGSVH